MKEELFERTNIPRKRIPRARQLSVPVYNDYTDDELCLLCQKADDILMVAAGGGGVAHYLRAEFRRFGLQYGGDKVMTNTRAIEYLDPVSPSTDKKLYVPAVGELKGKTIRATRQSDHALAKRAGIDLRDGARQSGVHLGGKPRRCVRAGGGGTLHALDARAWALTALSDIDKKVNKIKYLRYIVQHIVALEALCTIS